MNTTRNRSIMGGALLAGAFALALSACGGTPKETKNPKDVKAAGGGGQKDEGGKASTTGVVGTVPVKPKRKIAADAKAEFKKLVKRYLDAAKGGKHLPKAVCDDLASAFGDLYAQAPKLIEAKFNQGAALMQCGQIKKAEAVFRELLQKHPRHGAALSNLGMIAYNRGQTSTAIDFFQKAAAAKASGGYANLAMLDRDKALNGDTRALREAVDNIHRALAVDSSNIGAYEMLATVIYDHAKSRSQLDIARLIIVQALKLDPKHAPLYNLQGLVLLKMNEVTRALKQFRQAVAIDPSLIESHMNIGAITLSFRDYGNAERAFKTVLSSEKATQKMKIDATVGLGVAYRGQRKFKAALAEYEKAQQLAPGNQGIAYNIGILIQDYMFDASNPDAAIATLERAKGYLQKYADAQHGKRRKDVLRRLKNIRQMVPLLREQKKMMAEMKTMQAGAKTTPTPASKAPKQKVTK
ncbi:MAG: hypothetical protein CSA65_07040 [Proteobacteria bacterium]|nr:MAG: hypothetical protein CSB49_05315 [Pseudomonadota bacterium]PIE17904.1 MAG: hypothetical protein CSA65_07040 [Pseudomonadota bacterium]